MTNLERQPLGASADNARFLAERGEEARVNRTDMSEHLPPGDGRSKFYPSATDATPDSPSTPRRLATDDALLAGPNKGQEKGDEAK